jgi:D-amino-acid dehydrogenase
MRHSPRVDRPGLDSEMWRWMFQMLMNCTESRYETN